MEGPRITEGGGKGRWPVDALRFSHSNEDQSHEAHTPHYTHIKEGP